MSVFGHILFFFFNATATTEIYTLSLHDALPIFTSIEAFRAAPGFGIYAAMKAAVESLTKTLALELADRRDRKSTRLNSSHVEISYAVFCLKKKKKKKAREKQSSTATIAKRRCKQ